MADGFGPRATINIAGLLRRRRHLRLCGAGRAAVAVLQRRRALSPARARQRMDLPARRAGLSVDRYPVRVARLVGGDGQPELPVLRCRHLVGVPRQPASGRDGKSVNTEHSTSNLENLGRVLIGGSTQ